MASGTDAGRQRQAGAHLIFFALFVAVVFGIHSPLFGLPYFWDELGQFVPAALDILRTGAWIPHSTVPNVHPPGVMAYLALIWRFAGYSIVATRLSMLALASLGVLATFLLAIELCRTTKGLPAFAAALFLLADPLFYTQAMMAQLDMPAMVFTALALLFYLQRRYAPAALASLALVMCKETGVILPLLFTLDLARRKQYRPAALFLPSFAALALWILYLWRETGHLFGDSGFTHYNVTYALHPVRVATALLRHLYFLFFSDFRWVGAVVLLFAARRTHIFRTPAWKLAGLFAALHILLVSALGGAALERYLLPALPILYCAIAAAFTETKRAWRLTATFAMTAGLLSGWFLNPPFPFPYENNLAMVDFVNLHAAAANFIERHHPDATIYTAWPLTAALRRPEFGYVSKPLRTVETSDLHDSTLRRLDPAKVDALILYSRTWDPPWGVLRLPAVDRFLRRFYDYEPQMSSAEVTSVLGLRPVMRWDRRGQWIEIFAKPGPDGILHRTPLASLP